MMVLADLRPRSGSKYVFWRLAGQLNSLICPETVHCRLATYLVSFPYLFRTGSTALSTALHLASVRNRLQPRREPYWGPPLEQGRFVGVRKRDDGTCTWIARLRDDDGRQKYRSLGQVTDKFNQTAAKHAAEDWFRNYDIDVVDKPLTVAQACREYVADLEVEDRYDTAHDAGMRFKRTVYDHPIGRVLVEKLKTSRLKAWRSGLGGAKSTQNRNLGNLKAALNLAVDHHRVSAAVVQQWRAVKLHKNAGTRRELYLDLQQRRALVEACGGPIRDLIEAAALTGARPGELVKALRSHFDVRTGCVRFSGKTGSRTVPLSPAAIDLFKRLAQGKLPAANLLTRDDGKSWQRSDWYQLVRDAASKAKLPGGVVLYTLRHSWITEALLAGMPTLEVARLTGTSLQMIERHYGHLVAEAARERLAAVEML